MSSQNLSDLRRRVEDLFESAHSLVQKRKTIEIGRRNFLKMGAVAGAGVSVLSGGAASLLGVATPARAQTDASAAPSNFNELTIAQLQAMMGSGGLASLHLVDY